MRKNVTVIGIVLLTLVIIGIVTFLVSGSNLPVLNTKGLIADKERNLIIITVLLSLIVVIPVFFMLFFIGWKYRASNTKAKYSPDWDHNKWIEAIWWGVPCAIILVLGIITWQATRELDPFRPIDSNVKPVKVQVVALQWKWLFIYPEQHIATVNQIMMPVGTPVNFEITADAPMNSFWIPALGGQVYAMTGMSTKLHLMANEPGTYQGSSANISGKGFSGMTFTATSLKKDEFDAWVKVAQDSSQHLDKAAYDTLARPSKDIPPANYQLKQADLYDTIVMKYMAPMQHDHMMNMNTADMHEMEGH